MANQLLTISMITKESLRVLVGSLKFVTNVNQGYNDQFAIKGAKIGQTINIRKPARYIGRTGPVVSIESQTETYQPLTLDQQYGVDLSFTSAEQTMSLDLYSDRVIKPAMANIASRIDAYGLNYVLPKVYNQVGTPGTAVTSLKTYLDAGVKLDNNLAPRDGTRAMLTDPQTQATATSLGLNLFNPQPVISEQYKTGLLANALGFDWYMDQNMPIQPGAVYGGTPVVNGLNQTGASLITNGWSAGVSSLPVGTVFTVTGVKAVNPQTKATLAVDQQFVVTATATDAAGVITIPISPAIVTSGAFQNVSRAPTTGDPIVVAGATTVGTQLSVAYHPDAFVFGVADLDVPGGTDMAYRASDPNTGLSVRVIRDFNVVTDQWITRFDILFGFNTLYEQLACRVATS
jgi:P22 coat protein - gene protein 5